MKLHRIFTGLAAASAVCLSAELYSAPANAATTFYGIDNNNNIWEVDPVRQFNVLVNEIGRTIPNCAITPGCLNSQTGSNGIAYDSDRDHLFFFYNSTSTGWNLQFWNRKSSGPASLKVIPGIAGTSSIPANAAYYDNALWYFDGSTSSKLNKAAFSYNSSQDDIVSANVISYDLSTYLVPVYQPGIYGDIAIDVQKGFLYGSQADTGRFFKINLNQLDAPCQNPISTPYLEAPKP